MNNIVERLRKQAKLGAPVCAEAADEIERLLENLDAAEYEIERLGELTANVPGLIAKINAARNDALEETAQVAEEWPPRRWMTTKQLAAAIRALKEKTS